MTEVHALADIEITSDHEVPPECQWFLKCGKPTTHVRSHRTLGWVFVCETHAAWLLDNPTADIPPLAVAAIAKH